MDNNGMNEGGDSIAQRFRLRFSPSHPGFESGQSQYFCLRGRDIEKEKRKKLVEFAQSQSISLILKMLANVSQE